METIINDSIHGPIELDPACVTIINTPEFQRLRHLKQLGPVYYVYPGASHNRFEHCIGVCYLAGKFVEQLKAKQEDLEIDDKDVLCVKIAGLCHDLGHGPFSHQFEVVINSMATEKKWKHEQASEQMFDQLIRKCGSIELDEEDKLFIKALIRGTDNAEGTGRGPEKGFLYQIVANDENGIDVDKWDYFARDSHMLGMKNSFDHLRCMQMAKVVDGRIYYRNKEMFNLFEMFHTRYSLHYRAYKHKTVTVIDEMIKDAFMKCKEYKWDFLDNKTILEAVDDMKLYIQLTDDILYNIGRSNDPKLKQAREIVERINKRDLYKIVDTHLTYDKNNEDEIKKYLIGKVSTCSKDHIAVKVVKFDYENGNENPMKKVRCFTKEGKVEEVKSQMSKMLFPEKFCRYDIRVIYKGNKRKTETKIKEAFDQWKTENIPQGQMSD